MQKDNFLRYMSDRELEMCARMAFTFSFNVNLLETWEEEGIGDVAKFDVEEANGDHHLVICGEYGFVSPRTYNPQTMSFDESKYLLPTTDREFLWMTAIAICNHGDTNKYGERYFDAAERRIMSKIERGENIPSKVNDLSKYALDTKKDFELYRKIYNRISVSLEDLKNSSQDFLSSMFDVLGSNDNESSINDNLFDLF